MQLENDDWGNTPTDAPPYIRRIYKLRHKVLSELDVADLQLLVEQEVSLNYIMPLAIDVLKKFPLVEGYHYCGDILHCVLLVNPEFYKNNQVFKQQVKNILKQVPTAMTQLDEIDRKYAKQAVDEGLVVFNKKN